MLSLDVDQSFTLSAKFSTRFVELFDLVLERVDFSVEPFLPFGQPLFPALDATRSS